MASSCRICNNPSLFVCSHCQSSQYCSSNCRETDWPVHSLICTQVGILPPPFPIPRDICFLSYQDNKDREEALYGSKEVLETLANSTKYQALLDVEYDFRVKWITQVIQDMSVDILFDQYQIYTQTFMKRIFLMATHAKETHETMSDTFEEFTRSIQKSIRNPPRLVELMKQLLTYCLTNRDFVLNAMFLGRVVSYVFEIDIEPMQESNWRLVSGKQREFKILRETWERNQPTFNQKFAVAMTYEGRNYVRVVTKGMVFYRGQGSGRSPTPRRDTAWFAVDPWSAMTYIVPDSAYTNMEDYCTQIGTISAFRTANQFVILDMSSADNVRKIRALATGDMLETFDELWKIQGGVVKRTSLQNLDIYWVNWLCSKGYAGYIASQEVGLHPELFLCTWKDHLEYAGTYDTPSIIRMDFCQYPSAKVKTSDR